MVVGIHVAIGIQGLRQCNGLLCRDPAYRVMYALGSLPLSLTLARLDHSDLALAFACSLCCMLAMDRMGHYAEQV